MSDVCYPQQRQRRHNRGPNAPLTIAFEDVPLDEARRMSRGPRMDAELHHALKGTSNR